VLNSNAGTPLGNRLVPGQRFPAMDLITLVPGQDMLLTTVVLSDPANGTINPSAKTITGTGTIRDGCGPITMTGTFTSDFVSISGSYKYGKGGGGSFTGCIQP